MSDMLFGLLIGTGILMVLEFIAVRPLTAILAGKKLDKPEYARFKQEPLDETSKKELQGLVTPYYIMADVAVMGVAGILLGAILGLFFIGVSPSLRGWPGMITFIVASLIGTALFIG